MDALKALREQAEQYAQQERAAMAQAHACAIAREAVLETIQRLEQEAKDGRHSNADGIQHGIDQED